MAVTSIHSIRKTEEAALKYIVNGAKTDNGNLVSSFSCSADPKEAAEMFQQVRKIQRSKVKTLCQHVIQSFKPGEITAEKSHKAGLELAEKLLGGEYQFVLATHVDKEHIHNHLIFNNVNMFSGYSFETLENKGHKRSWKSLREKSDELCEEHGLSIVKRAEHNKAAEHYEWEMNRQGLSWKAKLKLAISDCIEASKDFEDFLQKCPDYGIIVEYNPNHKNDLKFKLAEHVKEKPNIKFTRAKTLGWYYEKPQLEKLIMLVNHPELIKTKRKYIPVEVDPNAGYGLRRWADIQNMKEASKIMNILTEYGVNDSIELENLALAKMTEMGLISSKLNTLNTKIQDLSQLIKTKQTLKKYAPIVREWKELSGRKRTKFEKVHYDELSAHKKATAKMRETYPNGKPPALAELEEQKTALEEERSMLNEMYKTIKADADKLNYARQALEEYRHEREVQEHTRNKREHEL